MSVYLKVYISRAGGSNTYEGGCTQGGAHLHADDLLKQGARGGRGRVCRQPHRFVERHGRQLAHLFRHGGAEQQRLPLPWRQRHDLLYLRPSSTLPFLSIAYSQASCFFPPTCRGTLRGCHFLQLSVTSPTKCLGCKRCNAPLYV